MDIIIENLNKTINGKVILQNINLKFEEGKIYAIVGRNGSGKSMLFKSIVGFLKPTSGKVIFGKKDIYKEGEFASDTRVLIDVPHFNENLSGKKNLQFLANIQKKISDKEIEDTLKRLDLYTAKDLRVGKYSLGMKQKLGIAQVIMEDPKVLILDEPFNSLDKESVETVRNILLKEKEKNKIILITSHIKDDIQILADEIIVMNNGKIVKQHNNIIT